MSRILDDVLAANRAHVATFGDKGKLRWSSDRNLTAGLVVAYSSA